jgi:GntR family transcriptional regulator / MocR family aminotransferase
MVVQQRSLAGLVAHQEERHRARAVPAALERAVTGVTPYRLSPAPRGGLIFGYSDLNERAIADGVARLARAVSHLR